MQYFKTFKAYQETMVELVHTISRVAPSLTQVCYLSGSTPISCEHLKHVISIDLDWHSKRATTSPRKGVEELKKFFGKDLEAIMVDHEYGMYKCMLNYNGIPVNIDAFANFEDINAGDTNKSKLFKVDTISPKKYLQAKLQCIEEREEVKDLYHLCALDKAGFAVQKGLNGIDQLKLVAATNRVETEWPIVKKDLLGGKDMKGPTEQEFLDWVQKVKEKAILQEQESLLGGEDNDPDVDLWDIN